MGALEEVSSYEDLDEEPAAMQQDGSDSEPGGGGAVEIQAAVEQLLSCIRDWCINHLGLFGYSLGSYAAATRSIRILNYRFVGSASRVSQSHTMQHVEQVSCCEATPARAMATPQLDMSPLKGFCVSKLYVDNTYSVFACGAAMGCCRRCRTGGR